MRGREIIVWRYPRRLIEHDPLWIPPLLIQVDFEVFGQNIHPVHFVQHAKEIGDHLGIKGWITHTRYGSVIGQIQGEKFRVEEMALWLRGNSGYGSRIEFCEFRNLRMADGYEYRKLNARI